jgi:L-threonylcarbamoyladenylate synthase
MEIISNPTLSEIKKAAKALIEGRLVAFPTETVYGLGADATNEKAVGRIYSSKGRPLDHPLIVHISSLDLMNEWAINIPAYAIQLAEEFWPGPITLILKRSHLAKDFITGSQDTVGLRVPAHPIAQELLSSFEKLGGSGIAAPSANRFGAVSPTTSAAVGEELGDNLGSGDLILDGGQSQVGIESTIVDCTNSAPKVLRPGGVSLEQIEAVTVLKVVSIGGEINIKVSGLLNSHYSPKAQVILNALAIPGDGFLAMENVPTPDGVTRLASPHDLEHYARQLYLALRSGDQQGIKRIVVIPPEGDGLAEAIRDRLSKAQSGNLNQFSRLE